MKRSVSLILLILLCACKGAKVNWALNLMGIYEDRVKLDKISSTKNEVVFIPMHHLGTKLFYDDVGKKIDSLKSLGYYFYTEKIKSEPGDTLTWLKLRKLTGVAYSKEVKGYKKIMDSMYKGKITYKKELIDQPTYRQLGVDSLNSKNVDVTTKSMIQYYETKYGAIKLEPCDFETKEKSKYNCSRKGIRFKNIQDAILNYRNQHIIQELEKEHLPKIAIIYGAGHFKGIKQELLQKGYREVGKKLE